MTEGQNVFCHLLLSHRLGEGSQASVWLGRDSRNGRSFAVKLLHPDMATPSGLARLRREAQLLGSILDPGLPAGQLFLQDETTGLYGIVMDYVEGISLSKQNRRQPLSAGQVWAVCKEVARVVAVLHVSGIVHRDIKASNILLRPGWESGSAGTVVLVDLGIARGAEGKRQHATAYTVPGTIVGSVPFVAPEVLTGKVSESPPNVDVFAIGVLIWYLLFHEHPTGLPLDTEEMEILLAYLRGDKSSLNHELSADVERQVPGLISVALRCVDYLPEARYSDANALFAALNCLVDSAPHSLSRSQMNGPSAQRYPQSPTPSADRVSSYCPVPQNSPAPPAVHQAPMQQVGPHSQRSFQGSTQAIAVHRPVSVSQPAPQSPRYPPPSVAGPPSPRQAAPQQIDYRASVPQSVAYSTMPPQSVSYDSMRIPPQATSYPAMPPVSPPQASRQAPRSLLGYAFAFAVPISLLLGVGIGWMLCLLFHKVW